MQSPVRTREVGERTQRIVNKVLTVIANPVNVFLHSLSQIIQIMILGAVSDELSLFFCQIELYRSLSLSWCFDVFAEESRKIKEGKDQELVISLEHMTLRNSNPCHRVRNEFSRAISFNIYENALIMFQIQFVLVEDIKMNDGSAEKPYFMSDSLKGILDLQNRPPPEGNDEGRK